MRPCTFALLLLCAGGAGAADLELREAWVRAVPPVADATAAYFVLANRGDTAVELEGARAGFASRAMFHEMARDQGQMRMRHLDALTVPAGGEVRFAPGSRHLMLTGLDPVPAEGEVVEICLILSSGELCHAFPVRRDEGN